MNHRTQIVIGMVAFALVLSCSTGWAAFPEDVRQALRGMVEDKVQSSLSTGGIPKGKTLSLLPMYGDDGGYIKGLLKEAITRSGLKYVEGKSDPFWSQVLQEVEWDERKADMLDPATLVTFGKLKATQLLMYGFVREATVSGRRVFVEIELHVSSIETKEHLWGDVLAERIYKGEEVQGIVDINDAVRDALSKAFEQGKQTLRDARGRLEGIETAAVVPLAGDINGYVTARTEEILSSSIVMPKNLNVRTLGEAETLLRDDPSKAGGIVYGSVRDLSRKPKGRHFMRDGNFMVIDHEVRAEVQLRLQKTGSGEIPWSVTLSATAVDPVAVTWGDWLSEHPGEVRRTLIWVVGILVVVIVLAMFLKSTRRVR